MQQNFLQGADEKINYSQGKTTSSGDMPIKKIEQLKKDFQTNVRQGKFTAKHGGINMVKFWNWIQKALKENTEQVISAMLVEEREILRGLLKTYNVSPSDLNTKLVLNREQFINQCCALQKDNEKKIKQELCKQSKS